MGSRKEFWVSERARSPDSQRAKQWAALAEELAGVGYWQLDVQSKAIRWSPGMFRLYGLEVGEEPDLAAAMAAIHPDDSEEAHILLRRAMEDGIDYASQVRLKRADGTWGVLRNRAVCHRNKAGEVVSVLGTVIDVTRDTQAEEALKRSETRYRLLAENATEIMTEVTTNGTITFITPASKAILGYEPDELIGHRSLEFTHPLDTPGVVKLYTELIAAGPGAPSRIVQYRGLHKDGHWVWLEGSPKVIFDDCGRAVSMQDVLRDISDRKDTEEKLKLSEERFRLLAEKSRDIIVQADKTGTIVYASPGCRMLGYSQDEMVGMNATTLVHPDDLSSFLAKTDALFRDASTDKWGDREHRIRTKDGNWLWLQGNPAVTRDEHGAPNGIINAFRDVTERRALDAQLDAARAEAEAAAAAKSEFLANMSHEIRTPLTSIIGFSQLLKELQGQSDQARGFADRVVQASQGLLAVVNDILDFSKLEAGQIEIKPEATVVESVFRESVELFSAQAASKDVTLELVIDPAVPASMLIDGNRVRQVLLNLIGNAVKFTEQGSVTISVSYDQPRVRCSVRDTGPGISEDQQHKLFQRFSQVDGSSQRSHGGTGLGLAICKGLVEAMHGTIAVRSALGAGSEFVFEIPAPSAAVETQTPAAIRSDTSLTGLRVLAVDDNAVNRALLNAILAPFSLSLTLAATGPEAVVLASIKDFDVILMDLHMPGMSGYEAAKTLRRAPGPNANTPLLAFTADAVRNDPRYAEAGFAGLILKPLSPADLLATLNEIATDRHIPNRKQAHG